MAKEIRVEAKTGTVREIFFLKMLKNAGHYIFYSRTGDFQVNNKIFEIGGKSKTGKQIMHTGEKGFLVKDELLYGNKKELPLYFGLLY